MIGNPRARLPQNLVDLYDQIRFEWASAFGRWRQPRRLHFPEHRYVNLGCGPCPDLWPPGFLQIDHFALRRDVPHCADFRFPLPLDSGSFDGAFCHHVLEHLDYEAARRFLGECHRILAQGGTLRIAVPDAEKAMRLYASEPNRLFDLMPKYHGKSYQTAAEVVNEIFHADRMNRHCFGWDFETLARRLREAGFNQIERMECGQSLDPKLAQDNPRWSAFSLYVDAVK